MYKTLYPPGVFASPNLTGLFDYNQKSGYTFFFFLVKALLALTKLSGLSLTALIDQWISLIMMMCDVFTGSGSRPRLSVETAAGLSIRFPSPARLCLLNRMPQNNTVGIYWRRLFWKAASNGGAHTHTHTNTHKHLHQVNLLVFISSLPMQGTRMNPWRKKQRLSSQVSC